jgi:hypothetical protein
MAKFANINIEFDAELKKNYYDAYVYEIKIFKGKETFYYVGWHMGLISDEYLCSSSDPILKEDYANFDHEFNVIETGTAYDMAYLEWKMLSKVDAKNNPFYYNKSNGGGKYLKKHGNIIMIDKLEDEIKAKKYLAEPTPLQKFIDEEIRPYQIRDLDGTKTSHVTDLSHKIDELEGDMSTWEPIVIFEDMDGPGEDVLGQGNHTTTAGIKSSKNYKISDIPTQMIPKSVWSKLSPFELKTLLLRLNPLPKKPSLPTSDPSAVQWLTDNFKNNGVPIKSDSNIEELKKWGFSVQKITKGLMPAAVKAVNNKNGLKPGHIIIDYTSGEAKQFLTNAIEENTSDTEFAMAWSSNWLKWDKIMNDFFPKHYKKNDWTIYIYHTSTDNKKTWEDTQFSYYKTSFDILAEQFGIQMHWEPLLFSKKNPLLNIKKKIKKVKAATKKAA